MSKARKKALNVAGIAAAAAAGFVYSAGMNAAAKMKDGDNFINKHYIDVKGYGALAIGAGMVYFGKGNPYAEPAGYALLGVGGNTLATKISFGSGTDSSADQPAQGLQDRHKKIFAAIKNASRGNRPTPGLPEHHASAQMHMNDAPAVSFHSSRVPTADPYGVLAYAQTCQLI